MSKASGGGNHGRVRARRCAVQALYQWQMAGQEPRDIVKEFVSDRELVSVDMDYFTGLVSEVPHVTKQRFDPREVGGRGVRRLAFPQ